MYTHVLGFLEDSVRDCLFQPLDVLVDGAQVFVQHCARWLARSAGLPACLLPPAARFSAQQRQQHPFTFVEEMPSCGVVRFCARKDGEGRSGVL